MRLKLHWMVLIILVVLAGLMGPGTAHADCDIWTTQGTMTVTTVASQTECDALVALKVPTNVTGWTDNTGWIYGVIPYGPPTDPCGWYGVMCNSSGVNRLTLGTNNLVGMIPTSLGDLGNLTALILAQNDLTGTIPAELGNLSSLYELSLRYNDLTGSIPAELGNLSNLNILDLNQNDLTGPIPPELGNQGSLRLLTLTRNNLTGSIPTELGNLSNLTSLRLSENQLTGPIPTELRDLGSLETLALNGNLLHGDLTTALNGLQDTVTFLWLSDGLGKNDCFTTTDSILATWLDSIEDGPGWNECEADSDGDGIPGVDDNCPTVANANQADCDGDDYGDVCDFVDDDPAIFFPIRAKSGKTAVIMLGGGCP